MFTAPALPPPSLASSWLPVTRGRTRCMKRLAQCPRLREAALPFYLWETGVLDASPAGIYRGALDLPPPPALAPSHPQSARPSKKGVKRGVKGSFVLQRAIPWQFCGEITWRQHQPRHLLCPPRSPLWKSSATFCCFRKVQKLLDFPAHAATIMGLLAATAWLKAKQKSLGRVGGVGGWVEMKMLPGR